MDTPIRRLTEYFENKDTFYSCLRLFSSKTFIHHICTLMKHPDFAGKIYYSHHYKPHLSPYHINAVTYD